MIFVSYSRKDASLVVPLTKLLRASGHEVFLDQENLNYGEDWKEQLGRAIGRADRFLLFWSRNTEASPYVAEEWKLALRTPGCKIVPILLDGTPLPPELQRFHGSADLAPLLKALRSTQFVSGVLGRWWVVLACGVAVALLGFVGMLFPITWSKQTLPAPEEDMETPSFLHWVVVVSVLVFLAQSISWYRRRRLYRRIATSISA